MTKQNNHNLMISIVIPLYNKEKSVFSTLQSVCQQTYTDFELIVVDDGSTDNSAKIVASYHDSRIRLIYQPNSGVSAARNRGIRAAKYPYIAFLDADDVWDPQYLQEQVRMINDFQGASMWGINFAETDHGQIIRSLATGLPDGYRGYVDDYFNVQGRISDLFCSSSVVVRRNVFDKVGFFDERLKYSEDTDMWWRIIATYPVAFYDRYMVSYRLEAENRTQEQSILLRYHPSSVVDKFRTPQWQQNTKFYKMVNQVSAQWIAMTLFSDPPQRDDAYAATKKLDYSVIPPKYMLLFKTPYWFGKCVYLIIQRIKSRK